jgi:hypothetical protein
MKKLLKLFLDDERFPPDDGEDWKIVRHFEQATWYMREYGCPSFVSFDHDLSDDLTGLDVVNWMIERDLDMGGNFIPKHFDFYVHSQNPVGAENINSKLNAYLAQR